MLKWTQHGLYEWHYEWKPHYYNYLSVMTLGVLRVVGYQIKGVYHSVIPLRVYIRVRLGSDLSQQPFQISKYRDFE